MNIPSISANAKNVVEPIQPRGSSVASHFVCGVKRTREIVNAYDAGCADSQDVEIIAPDTLAGLLRGAAFPAMCYVHASGVRSVDPVQPETINTAAAEQRMASTQQQAPLPADFDTRLTAALQRSAAMEQRISNTISDLDTRIGFRFDNLEARVANSHSKGDGPIRPIRGVTGAVANGFPSSWVAFHRLSVQQLQDLLAFYGVQSENDTKPALKRAFARFTSLDYNA